MFLKLFISLFIISLVQSAPQDFFHHVSTFVNVTNLLNLSSNISKIFLFLIFALKLAHHSPQPQHAVPVVVVNNKPESFWANHLTLAVVVVSIIISLLGMFLYHFCKTARRAELAEFSNNLKENFRS